MNVANNSKNNLVMSAVSFSLFFPVQLVYTPCRIEFAFSKFTSLSQSGVHGPLAFLPGSFLPAHLERGHGKNASSDKVQE